MSLHAPKTFRYPRKSFALVVPLLSSLSLLCALTASRPAHAQDLLVGEYFNNNIWRIAPSGTKTLLITLPYFLGGARLCGFSFGPDGALYAAQFAPFSPSSTPGFITRVDLSGPSPTYSTVVSNIPGNAQNVKFDAAGNLYVGGDSTGDIRRYSPSGADLGVFATIAGSTYTAPMAFDSAGNLLVGNLNGQIRRFSPLGADLGTFATASGNLRSLAFNSAGNLFVGTANGTIERFSSSGVGLGTFATLAGANFNGLDFASNGDLYATNYTGSDIRRYSASGTALGTFSSGIDNPLGLAFLRSGTATVPEAGTGALVALPVMLTLAGVATAKRRLRPRRP